MLKKAAIFLSLFTEYAFSQLLLNLGKIANASNRVKQAFGALPVILTSGSGKAAATLLRPI